MARILIVVTSAAEYEAAGYRTGLWLGELTEFWDLAEKAGHEMVIASVSGGDVPIDPASLTDVVLALGGTKKRYRDRAYMNLLLGTKSLADVNADDFDVIYLTGGHGTMFDFPDSPELQRLVAAFADGGKIVSAVCHGPGGLLNVTLADGRPLLQGRRVTGFSWLEEKLAGRDKVVPFNLQERLTEKAASYDTATIPMTSHVVVDGNLITGQNPMSPGGVAKAVLEALDRR